MKKLRFFVTWCVLTLLIVFASCALLWQQQNFTERTTTYSRSEPLANVKSDLLLYEPMVDQADRELIQLQTNFELVNQIKEKWLRPPSEELAYNFTLVKNNFHAIKRMHASVIRVLNYKKNGFFMEAGAYNGVDLSNTLNLEMDYNWTGLLVEADPIYFDQLKSTNRKAWMINACLGPHTYPEKIQMTRIRDQPALSRIREDAPEEFLKLPAAQQFETQCFPFTTILAATLGDNQPLVVDYLSLDIEEAELPVLTTIPWDYIYIKVITIETWPSNDYELTKYLDSRGYKMVKRFVGAYVHDNLYVNRRYLREKDL